MVLSSADRFQLSRAGRARTECRMRVNRPKSDGPPRCAVRLVGPSGSFEDPAPQTWRAKRRDRFGSESRQNLLHLLFRTSVQERLLPVFDEAQIKRVGVVCPHRHFFTVTQSAKRDCRERGVPSRASNLRWEREITKNGNQLIASDRASHLARRLRRVDQLKRHVEGAHQLEVLCPTLKTCRAGRATRDWRPPDNAARTVIPPRWQGGWIGFLGIDDRNPCGASSVWGRSHDVADWLGGRYATIVSTDARAFLRAQRDRT
jgi:hypothetical protein